MKFDQNWTPNGQPKPLKVDLLRAHGHIFGHCCRFRDGLFFHVFFGRQKAGKQLKLFICWAASLGTPWRGAADLGIGPPNGQI